MKTCKWEEEREIRLIDLLFFAKTTTDMKHEGGPRNDWYLASVGISGVSAA